MSGEQLDPAGIKWFVRWMLAESFSIFLVVWIYGIISCCGWRKIKKEILPLEESSVSSSRTQ